MSTAILQARGVSRQFHGFFAVKNVDLQVEKGAIHALIGPNGAGKSTMFNLLTRFLGVSTGRIVFDGQDITDVAPARVARLGLVRSFQISAVFPTLTVLENVRLALQRKRLPLLAFLSSSKSLNRLNEEAARLLEDVDLLTYANRGAGELSYGRKRALEVATTLALEPRVLLLDEPMAGMAHEDIDRVTALIRRVAVGRTVLFVEHNLSVVAELCTRISVLQRGEIIAEGTYAQVSADARVREAYLGRSAA
jgi:branched-chain amino acid transport system ATP-binding protein